MAYSVDMTGSSSCSTWIAVVITPDAGTHVTKRPQPKLGHAPISSQRASWTPGGPRIIIDRARQPYQRQRPAPPYRAPTNEFNGRLSLRRGATVCEYALNLSGKDQKTDRRSIDIQRLATVDG